MERGVLGLETAQFVCRHLRLRLARRQFLECQPEPLNLFLGLSGPCNPAPEKLSGLFGGLLGAAGLFAVAWRVGPALEGALPLPPELQPLALVGPLPLLLVVAAGTLLGLLASAVSVGRHLR